jgi:hypothetical protein
LTVVFDTCATAAANGLGNRALTVGSTFLTFALLADWGGPGAGRCAALGAVFAAQTHSQHDQPYDYKKGQHPERDFSTFFHFPGPDFSSFFHFATLGFNTQQKKNSLSQHFFVPVLKNFFLRST